MKYLLLFLFLSPRIGGYSQKWEYNWAFGYHSGIDFNTAPPNIISTNIDAFEGASSVSDSMGNLLFYADASTIYNKQHSTMSNGDNMLGNYTTTQTVLIVPFPDHPQQYYVIHNRTYYYEKNGLHYSVVDMTLDGGLGGVLPNQKSIEIPHTSHDTIVPGGLTVNLSDVSEKLIAIKHANGRDYWLVGRKHPTSQFYAYLLSPSGLDTIPILSAAIPDNPTYGGAIMGCMKASEDGKHIAVAYWPERIEIADFDRNTGEISNTQIIVENNLDKRFYYGLAYSPNGQLLYFTTLETDTLSQVFIHKIFQYDIERFLGGGGNYLLEISTISEPDTNGVGHQYATMQLSPDKKQIYIANFVLPYLSCIESPNQKGLGCNFVREATHLNPNTLSLGSLPNFPLRQPRTYVEDTVCEGSSYVYDGSWDLAMDSVRWEGVGGWVSSVASPVKASVAVSDSGKYAMYGYLNGYEVIRKYLHLTVLPLKKHYAFASICADSSYLLPDGLAVNVAGEYETHIALPQGCDSVVYTTLSVLPLAAADLGADISRCAGDTVQLLATGSGTSFVWSTGSTQNILELTTSGSYGLTFTNTCGAVSDTVEVEFHPLPTPSLGSDTTICRGESLWLEAGDFASYLWQDGSTSPTYAAYSEGIYALSVRDAYGCEAADTLLLAISELPKDFLPQEAAELCNGETLLLRPNQDFATYSWNTGSTLSEYAAAESGVYTLWVSDAWGCKGSDSITLRSCEDVLFIPSAFSPNADGYNDVFSLTLTNATQWQATIYDRWGKVIHTLSPTHPLWNGENAPEGVYTLHLQFLRHHLPQTITKTITLVR